MGDRRARRSLRAGWRDRLPRCRCGRRRWGSLLATARNRARPDRDSLKRSMFTGSTGASSGLVRSFRRDWKRWRPSRAIGQSLNGSPSRCESAAGDTGEPSASGRPRRVVRGRSRPPAGTADWGWAWGLEAGDYSPGPPAPSPGPPVPRSSLTMKPPRSGSSALTSSRGVTPANSRHSRVNTAWSP